MGRLTHDQASNKLVLFCNGWDAAQRMASRDIEDGKCTVSGMEYTECSGKECKYALGDFYDVDMLVYKPFEAHNWCDMIWVNGVCHYFMVCSIKTRAAFIWRFSNSRLKFKHCQFDENAQVFTELFELDMTFNRQPQMGISTIRFFAIYVSRLQSILLIQEHGYCDDELRDGDIWRFRLVDNTWEKVEGVIIGYSINSATLSSDENYIVMANKDGLFVMDISDEQHFKVRQSEIGVPDFEYSERHFCRKDHILSIGGGMEDETLVVGWTRALFREKEFKHLVLPPLVLLQMIARWFSEEEIHYIHNSSRPMRHLAISLRRVLDLTD